MKRLQCFLLMLCMICSSVGCQASKNTADSNMQKVYYYNVASEPGQPVLAYEYREFDESQGTDRIYQIIDAMKHPEEINHSSVLPEDVQILQVALRGNVAYIDFSDSYADLAPLEQTLLTSASALSLFEQSWVEYVKFTAGGEDSPPLYNKYFNRETVLF